MHIHTFGIYTFYGITSYPPIPNIYLEYVLKLNLNFVNLSFSCSTLRRQRETSSSAESEEQNSDWFKIEEDDSVFFTLQLICVEH